jgi:hypothetical protein
MMIMEIAYYRVQKIIEKTKIENEMKGDGTNRKEFTKKL